MSLSSKYLDVDASDLFAAEEIERARAYHRPLYLALAIDLLLELVALVTGVATLVRLPLSAWRGWLYERRWGFSTQTFRGWLWDRAKALLVGVAVSGLGLVPRVGS